MLEQLIKTVSETSLAVYGQVENLVSEKIKEKGENTEIGFPETAYFLPLIYSVTGFEVRQLKDLKNVLEKSKSLISSSNGLIGTLNNGT